jgi:addiction module HigA family antidote
MAKKKLSPTHPGEMLLEEFLKPLEITQYQLAKGLGVSQIRISHIIRGERSITADTALRLGRYFGMSPQFWMNLQTGYDLKMAEIKLKKRIDKEVIPLKDAA